MAWRPVLYWVATLVIGVLVGAVTVGPLSATSGPPEGLEVREQNLDAEGNIKVHEQGVVPVELPTHTGQPGQDHVLLLTGSSGDDPQCGGLTFGIRVLPDGERESFGSWVVPEGKMFVLTDIHFGLRERTSDPWVIGDIVTLEVRSSTATLFDNFFQGTIEVDGVLAAGGEVWETTTIGSGVVFPSGSALCLLAAKGFEADRDDVSVINLTKMYGYLIDQ
jgi:hypothetical protein